MSVFPAGPASLGRYRILGRIASGGMAEVFAGCVKGEAGFERLVAIKRLSPALAEDEEFVRMFLHEARLAAQIRSAHVVQTLDLGRDGVGNPYLVMDLVVGASVARMMDGAVRMQLPIPADVATCILADACRGLHDAHEATARDGSPMGIVHRDVSPQNILVGEDGIARVADFGIARALGTTAETSREKMRGKLAYFSPEQANATPVDRRSDVFSLGIVAWELLTGQRLFKDDHPLRTLKRVLIDPIPRADHVRKEVPSYLATVVARALQREPRDRYPDAKEMEHALREAAQMAGLKLHPPHVAEFLATSCAPELAYLEDLLRTRGSWPGDVALPPQTSLPVQIIDRGATTLPEPEQSDAQTTEPTTALVDSAGRPSGSMPPLPDNAAAVQIPGRRQLWLALGAIGLLGIMALVPVLWGKGKSPGQSPSAPNIVQGPPPPPSSRDLLRVGTSFFTSIPSSALGPALFWSTVESSLDGRVKGSFVREIPSLENGSARILPGGKFEVRWQLLPSLKWSDGSPLRPEDLVMSQRLLPRSQVLEARKGDDGDALFLWTDHWAQAVGPFEPYASSVFEPLMASGGREAAWEYRKTHATPGLGPYRIVEVQIGERMVVEANPYFAGPPPSIRRIELQCTKDNARLVDQFERGELDMIFPNSITVEQAEDLKKRRPEAVHLRPSQNYVLLQPDITHPLLSTVEARQAIMMAIDRTALSREVFGRTDLVAHCPVLGLGPGAVKVWPFDSRKAAAEIARLKLRGVPFPLLHSSWPVDIRLARLVREYLTAAGMNISLQQVDRVSELRRNGRHGGILLYSLRDAGPEHVAAHFNLPALEAEFDRSVRHSGFDDWTASLLDREERAVNPQRRAQLTQELWMAFSERLPVLPLTFLLERVVVDPSLRGWDGSPSQRLGADIERWYFVR